MLPGSVRDGIPVQGCEGNFWADGFAITLRTGTRICLGCQFLTVSLARSQQLLAFEGDATDFVFGMEDSKRRAYNELFADRIIRLLPVGLSFDKCLALVENALNLGVKAA
jgi:hypothetical protein